MMNTRVRRPNFSAGPSALPQAVLERASDEFLDFDGEGMSILEMSHRVSPYRDVHSAAQDNLRRLLDIPEDYAVIFVTGGARMQFALVPVNLRQGDAPAHFVLTGVWSNGAFSEASKLMPTRVAWSGERDGYRRLPNADEIQTDGEASYLHYTSNNTIYGTQFLKPPFVGDAPIVCDMSSDILSRPVNISDFGLIYACAQKTMGIAGVTVVIAKHSLLERASSELPELWNYAKIAEHDSLLNTPPTFAIYMLKLVTDWLLDRGGLEAIARQNASKAALLYDAIDGDFYRGHADTSARSTMNVTFRTPDDTSDARFLRACERADLVGLRGHRFVGGLRASIYNAVAVSWVERLVEVMDEFRSRHR